MSFPLKKIPYKDLNSRQKENYNFQKVAGELADYGFNCLRLTDDWQGADFIACHITVRPYFISYPSFPLNLLLPS